MRQWVYTSKLSLAGMRRGNIKGPYAHEISCCLKSTKKKKFWHPEVLIFVQSQLPNTSAAMPGHNQAKSYAVQSMFI